MNGRGFLGTNASLLSDLSLVMGIGVAVLLTIGVALAMRKKFQLHRIVQSCAVSLNLLQVGVVMLGSFTRSAAPGIPSRVGDGYYAIALGHGLLGLTTLLLGLFIAVRANELLPPVLQFLRFHNFKLFMRTAYGLYMLSTALGVGVYLTWYTAKPTEVVAAAAPEAVAERAAQTVTIPMRDFAFMPGSVVVPLGSTVVWRNQDAAPHTATAEDGRTFQSDLLHTGEAFTFVADKVGEFRYYCEVHGGPDGEGMSGTITVVATGEPRQVAAPAPAPLAQPKAEQTPAPVAAPTPIALPRAQPHGLLTWRDDTLSTDALLISTDDLPSLPKGEVYAAWLSGTDANQFLGVLDGLHSLTFAASEHANLLADFDKLTVTRVAATASGEPNSTPILMGSLPAEALQHLRNVLVETDATPNSEGFVVGLRSQTEELLRHAQFLKEAQDENNLPLEKLHAEHLVNLIEGSQGEHYGDLNGNGRIDNPGDGFGVLANGDQAGYIEGMRAEARLAASSADASDGIKIHAGHVEIAGNNTEVRVTEIRARALDLFKARTTAETRSEVQRVLALAQQTIVGVDLNGDEQIAPIPGEGGVAVAYQHAQLMAAIPLYVCPIASTDFNTR